MRSVIIAVLAASLIAVACGGGDGGAGPPASGGPNLIENPGGEQNAEGYIGHNGATVSQDTTTASEGVASIKVTIPDIQGAGVQVWKAGGTTMTAVTPGVEYEFSLDAMGNAGKSMRLEFLWHRADGSFLVTTLGEVFFLPLSSFQRFSFIAVAPEEATLVVPQIVTDHAPGGPLTLWVDSIRLGHTSAPVSPTPSGTSGP
jgi:hypothetical protein